MLYLPEILGRFVKKNKTYSTYSVRDRFDLFIGQIKGDLDVIVIMFLLCHVRVSD